jgi:hypothetical protein
VQVSYSRRLLRRLDASEQSSLLIAKKNVELTKKLEEKHQAIGAEKFQKGHSESKFEEFVKCVKDRANFRNDRNRFLPQGVIPQPICDHFDLSSSPKK